MQKSRRDISALVQVSVKDSLKFGVNDNDNLLTPSLERMGILENLRRLA